MKPFSPKHKVLNYLAKWELMKDNPTWLENPSVRRVLTNGVPDQQKVKELFVERGMKPEDFDDALENNEVGLLDSSSFKATPQGVSRFKEIRLAHKADVIALENILKLEKRVATKVELDAIKDKEY